MAQHRPLRIEQSPLERARLWVEILAFVAAGAWALYTFVYETKLAPAFLPAHEIVSADVQRLAATPADYFERVNVTIENDGNVDVDTAALAVSVLGLKSSNSAPLQSVTGRYDELYRTFPLSAWQPLEAHGLLFDGAITGKRKRHNILRPGDKATFQDVAVVPRGFSVLQVFVEDLYGRYPIEPRVDVKMLSEHGTVELQSKGGVSIVFSSFFPV